MLCSMEPSEADLSGPCTARTRGSCSSRDTNSRRPAARSGVRARSPRASLTITTTGDTRPLRSMRSSISMPRVNSSSGGRNSLSGKPVRVCSAGAAIARISPRLVTMERNGRFSRALAHRIQSLRERSRRSGCERVRGHSRVFDGSRPRKAGTKVSDAASETSTAKRPPSPIERVCISGVASRDPIPMATVAAL